MKSSTNMAAEMNASMVRSFRDLRRSFQFFGLWPPTLTQKNRLFGALCGCLGLINIAAYAVVAYSEIAHIVYKWPDIIVVTKTAATAFTASLTLLKLSIMFINRHTLSYTILTIIESDFSLSFPLVRRALDVHPLSNISVESAKSLMKLQTFLKDSLKRKLKECRVIFAVNSVFVVTTLFGYCVPPLVRIIYYDSFHSELNDIYTPYGGKFPFEQTTSPGFQITFCMQIWATVLTFPGFTGFDILFGCHMILTTRQFELIIHVLENLEEYASASMAPQPDQHNSITSKDTINSNPRTQFETSCHNVLIQCIAHMERIMKYFESINSAYSFTLLAQLLTSSVVLCLVFFKYKTDNDPENKVTYFTYIFAAVSQLFLYCWYGQSIVNISTAISNCVYSTSWFQMPVDFRRSAMMLQRQAQRAVAVNVMGFSELSLPLFTSIFSTSMSYFTLLNSFLEEPQ